MRKIETAFVLGAGLGTRLRPLTLDTPKPMLPVGGVPLIERIFQSLEAAGIKKIVVNTHHRPEKYAERFKSGKFRSAALEFVYEPVLLDTGGGLKNALPLLGKSGVLVYNADILFGGDISKFLADFEKSEGFCASLILRGEGSNKNVCSRGESVCDMRFALGAPHEKTAQFAGIFAAGAEFLERVERFPKKIFSTVEVLLEQIKSRENSVKAYFDNSPWSDIGTPEEYAKTNALYEKRI